MKPTEKEFQWNFVSYLKANGWNVFEQVKSNDGKFADVIAYRPDVDVFIGFELKVIAGTFTYTKALRQVMLYQKKTFKNITPSIWCIVTPRNEVSKHEEYEYNSAWLTTRFMWRFGVGVCYYPENVPYISYVNGDAKDSIFLQTPPIIPDRYGRYINTPQRIATLVNKMKKDYVIWNE